MFSLLHKRSQLLLICGLVLSLGVLTACSSPEAVQANAPVMSSEVSSRDPNSGVSNSSSETVSSSASSVSVNSGVTSSPSSGTNSTTLQAPSTSKPSGGTVSTKPASTKPASTVTKPASTPTKPASKPTSTAPASKPTPTAPVETGINAKYYGANYGAEDASQYKQILSYAEAITSSSRYKACYDDNKSGFEDYYGIPYSDEANMAASIIGCFGNTASTGSHGNAYNAFTGGSFNCADAAKAIEATMHVNGIPCKVVWGKTSGGTPHMWTEFEIDGTWYQWGNNFSKGTPSGYTAYGSGYNY